MSYDTHLQSSDLERLLHGRADRKTVMAAHQHLLQCRRCRINLFVYDESLAGLYLDDFYGDGTAVAWRRQLDKPFDTLSYMSTRTLEISALNVSATRLRTTSSQSFQDVGTLVIVVECGHGMRKDNPTEAKFLLEGAIQALETRSEWPERERANLLVRAFAYLGNIHRILYEFEAARSALVQAQEYFRVAAPSPELRGELAWIEALLFVELRDYETGIAMLHTASTQLADVNASKALEVEISLAHTYADAGRLASPDFSPDVDKSGFLGAPGHVRFGG